MEHNSTASEDAPAPRAPIDEVARPPHERAWPRLWMPPFLRSLSLLPDVSAACRVAGIGRTTAYRHRDTNPDFAAAWVESEQLALDLLQRTAHTFATTGLPVKSKRTVTKTRTDKNGDVIETTTETVENESAERYGPMMIFMLKAWFPERYRFADRVEATGPAGGPILVQQLEEISELDAQIAALAAELDRRGEGHPVPVE